MFEKLKTNVIILALAGGVIAGGAGWKLLGIFERWVTASLDEGQIVVTGLEAVFVALLTAIVASYVGGILVLAGQVAAGSPPPQYPATEINAVINRVISLFDDWIRKGRVKESPGA